MDHPLPDLRRVPGHGPDQLLTLAALLPTQLAEAQHSSRQLLGESLRVERGAMPEPGPVHAAGANMPGQTCALEFCWLRGGEQARALLWLPADAVNVLVDRTLGGSGDMPSGNRLGFDDLSLGVLGYLAARLTSACRSPWQLHNVWAPGEYKPGPEPGLWVPLRVQLDGASFSAQLWIDPPAPWTACLPPTPVGPTLEDLEVQLLAIGGRATLRLSEQQALAPGDIIILDPGALRLRGTGLHGQVPMETLPAASTGWACQVDAESLQITSTTQEPDMPQGTRLPTDNSELEPLAGDTPLEVVVELAQFSIPLAQLAQLTEGDVLRTGEPLGQRVGLRVGGKRFAIGELVDVEGELGVCVRHLTRS